MPAIAGSLLDFFFWGYCKEKIYKTLPENIEDLEIAIRYLGHRRRCYKQRSRKLVKTHESLRQDRRWSF